MDHPYIIKNDKNERDNVDDEYPEIVEDLNDKWYNLAKTYNVLPKR